MAVQKLGDKIYLIRKHHGLSQEELGNKLGVSRQTVSQWEANLSQPKFEKLKKISEIFNMDLNAFVSDDEIHESDLLTDIVVCEIVQENADIQLADDEHVLKKEHNTNDLLIQNQIDDSNQEILNKNSKKKIKIVIASVVSVLLVGIVAVIVMCCGNSVPKNAIHYAVSRDFNFSFENIAWIIFIFVVITIILLGTFLIIKLKRRKK